MVTGQVMAGCECDNWERAIDHLVVYQANDGTMRWYIIDYLTISYSMRLSFCPFCGAKLEATDD